MKYEEIYNQIFDGVCSVCGQAMKKNILKQGVCPNCGWQNDFIADEHPNQAIEPDTISLNKAKKLYAQEKIKSTGVTKQEKIVAKSQELSPFSRGDIEFDYEKEKWKRKQRLIRGEFKKSGKYGIPLIRKQDIDLDKIQLMSYISAKPNDKENADKTIHFFIYDRDFDEVYDQPEKALEKLDQYYALLSPRFISYMEMPLARQMESLFKNRWCGAFWQQQGKLVIPSISWGSFASLDFSFDGIEEGCVVAISTYKMEDNKENFMIGYNKMLEKIKPSAVICYGKPFPEMKGKIKAFEPCGEELAKELEMKKLSQLAEQKKVDSKNLPQIKNPYQNVNFIALSYEETKKLFQISSDKSWLGAPKVVFVDVGKSAGIIRIVSLYTDKIEWFLDGKKIKTSYLMAGQLDSEISVVGLAGKLCFKLTNSHGTVLSQNFILTNKKG